jgi:hypothetical protein
VSRVVLFGVLVVDCLCVFFYLECEIGEDVLLVGRFVFVSRYTPVKSALARGAHSCHVRLVPCLLTSCLLLRVALTVFFVFRLYDHIVTALARGAHSVFCFSPVWSHRNCSCAWRSQCAILLSVSCKLTPYLLLRRALTVCDLALSCDCIVNPCRLVCVVSSHHGGHGCW